MPLSKGKSKKDVSVKLGTEVAEAKGQKQAAAIALDIARNAGAKIPKRKGK